MLSKFLEKHLWKTSFSIKMQRFSLHRANLLKEELFYQYFSKRKHTFLETSFQEQKQQLRSVPWKQVFLKFQDIKRNKLQFQQNLFEIPVNNLLSREATGLEPATLLKLNFFTDIFQKIFLLFRNTYLKKQLCVISSKGTLTEGCMHLYDLQ